MKYYHELSIDGPPLPKSDFEALCHLMPEAVGPSGLRYKLLTHDSNGDEFIQHALNLFNKHSIPRRITADGSCYGYTISRFYEEQDLLQCDLLLLQPTQIQKFTDPLRDEQGRLLLMASNAQDRFTIASIFGGWTVVSDTVRCCLEAGGFIGLRFQEVAVKGEMLPEPFWELSSSITLPKMPHPERFVHRGVAAAEPFQGDYSRVVLISDSPFAKAEIHYRKSDLSLLGLFDVAGTFENYMEPHPALVISQRFYRHCLKHNISLRVTPVRIDPG